MKILPSKYVCKVKENKPKIRLVALGYRQTSGVGFNETYAPVFSMTKIRSVLAVVGCNNFKLQQVDVKTAFVNGDLGEDVFMAVSEGLKDNSSDIMVCKLLRSIYGLKKSPREWYAKMHEFLLILNFTSSRNDPCLYGSWSYMSVTLPFPATFRLKRIERSREVHGFPRNLQVSEVC